MPTGITLIKSCMITSAGEGVREGDIHTAGRHVRSSAGLSEAVLQNVKQRLRGAAILLLVILPREPKTCSLNHRYHRKGTSLCRAALCITAKTQKMSITY